MSEIPVDGLRALILRAHDTYWSAEPPAEVHPNDAALADAALFYLPALLDEIARLRRIEAAAIAFRRAERAGGACDVETTYRLQKRVDDAREALDAALGGGK